MYNYIDKGIFVNISNKDLPVKKLGEARKYNKVRKVALNNTKGRSIEERPGEVEKREDYGHWEMDSVESGKGSKACLLVLTERKSREELIFKLDAKTQENVVAALDHLENELGERFSRIFKSITMDNGSEFLSGSLIERSIRLPDKQRTTVYYAHPYSAWERGSNENANKLIRRFIPKGADINDYTDDDIKLIEHWINNYPRRIFGYKTSKEIAASFVA